jgi:hypothetical protein
MNPSDANAALATLRQLKEMLDAGALTPQEFETLKKKLLFGPEADGAITEPPLSETLGQPASALEPTASLPVVPAQTTLLPASATPESTDWLAAAAPVLLENTPVDPLIEAPEERRNPLTLVFLIGGALVLLALVLYLTLGNNTPDEHLTSTSQTAADSTATAPEVGPQAEQLTLPPAVPETIRVAHPIAPTPVAKPASTQFKADSVATPATNTPAAVVPAKPAAKPTSAPATPVAADTAI